MLRRCIEVTHKSQPSLHHPKHSYHIAACKHRISPPPSQYKRQPYVHYIPSASFSVQQKQQRKHAEAAASDVDAEIASEQMEDDATYKKHVYGDELVKLTPRQKIREWTRSFHRIQSTRWIKKHFGLPFWGLHVKYLRSRYNQQMWATRIMRRESLGEQWRMKSVVYPTEVHIKAKKKAAKPNSSSSTATKSARIGMFGDPEEDHSDDEEEEDGYDNILESDTNGAKRFDEDDLNYLFYYKPPLSYVSSGDAKTWFDDEGQLKETADEETIVRGVQYWFDTYSTRKYWDAFNFYMGNIIFTDVKWKEHYLRMDAKQNAIRDSSTNLLRPKDASKKLNPYSIIPEENPRSEFIPYGGRFLSDFVDFKPTPTRTALTYTQQTLLANGTQQQQQPNNNTMATTTTADATATSSGGGDVADDKFDHTQTEGYKFNRTLKWFWGHVSGQSLEHNVVDVEKIEFGDKDDIHEIQRVIGARAEVDMRTDMHHNKRLASLPQLWSLVPSTQERRILFKLQNLALKKACQLVLDDYRWVFRDGGGEVLRYGEPPQISLQEFNCEDQFECAMGSFGAEHSLFSDWFLAIDNKHEACDKSYGEAKIVDDRLVFQGFLIHSSVEMAHRTRDGRRNWTGFVNLVSNEFEPELDLAHYYAIVIKLRTDGRPYLLGLECMNRNTFMIFNGVISLAPTPDGEWDYYEIPMHHFRPYDEGQFVEAETKMMVRYVRSMGLQAIGCTGSFKLEVAWIRAMTFEARFDVEDEDVEFIKDVDALGLYKEDILRFHIIQHQYFIDSFPDPFRFEDNGVFDDKVYLGPPRAQREHFGKVIPTDMLKYIDVIDDIPLTIQAQKELQYFLDSDDMYMFENYLTDKLIGATKAVQHLYKADSECIADATNNLLYNQLKNQSRHNAYLTSGVYHNENIHRVHRTDNSVIPKMPFLFKDIKQTPNSPITILTRRRRALLRFSVPDHLREREPGKHPDLVFQRS